MNRVLLLVLLMGLVGCKDDAETGPDAGSIEETDTAGTEEEPLCARDDSEDLTSAVSLAIGDSGNGYVCPVGDQDWWALSVPGGDRLVRVSLSLEPGVSPVELSYALWSLGSDGGLKTNLGIAPPEQVGGALSGVHCGGSGPVAIVVSDSADNASDFRRRYSLNVTTGPEPDVLEPNDTLEEAVQAGLGDPIEGWISCAGDHDWFEVDAFAGEALDIRVVTDANIQTRIRVRDATGTLIADEAVAGGSLDRVVQLNGPGPHSVELSDDNDRDADPDNSYVLTLDTVVDLDPNEPNPTAVDATPLGTEPLVCGGTWSEWRTETGTIGAPGDNDWFRLPLTGCERGILEARLTLQGASEVNPALALVRPHTGSPCEFDDQCHALNVSCNNNAGCRDWFETCLPQGQCAGASACLPEGHCGGTQIAKQHGSNVHFAVPIADEPAVYLRVSDFQANDAAPGAIYELKVRVRTDLDRREPDNPFFYQLLSSTPITQTLGPIEEVPVHDCTRENGYADCCSTEPGAKTWNRGNIGYHNDIDWFRYRHPCPGGDCLLRIHWEADAGPVDFLMGVWRGTSLWYDGIIPVQEKSWHGSRRNSFGGDEATDTCFYAFAGHSGNPFWYRVSFRDWAKKIDFAPDQQYRFCVEKVSNFCREPCQVLHGGECGP